MFAKRTYNACRIITGYLLSRITRRPVHYGMPLAFSAEPTTRCNLKCPECPSGQREHKRPAGNIRIDFFKNVIGQLSPTAFYLTLYFQGEPYLHPGFFEMVSYAKSKKLYVATSTNGQFLTRETSRETVRSGLDKLIVSVDGADQESYAAYRVGGSLETVVEGLIHLADAKRVLRFRKPKTVIQSLLLRTNQHQKEAIRKLAKEVKANKVEFKTAQFYNFENGNPLMPEEEKDSRYKKAGESTRYVIKNRLRNHCFRMWSSCVITWDGLVVPCCFDKDSSHVMGDLKQQSFEEIWHGEKYTEFRKEILQSRKSIDICKNCTQKF